MPAAYQKPLLQIKQQLFFSYLFNYEKFRHYLLLKEVRKFAAYFTDSVAPALLAKNQTNCTFHIANGQLRPSTFTDLSLSDCPRFVAFFKKKGIEKLSLDCRLEKNQIIESLTVVVHVASQLRRSDVVTPPSFIYSSENLANILVTEGLQRFCALTFFDKAQNTLVLSYSYCELFYTQSLKKLLQSIGQPLSHLFFFKLAPWAGVLTFFLLFMHIWFWGSSKTSELLAGIVASSLLGLTITYFMKTLASTVYDKEHQELLLQERIQEITTLSHFPEHNPNPIIKTDNNAEILFHNPAALRLLEKLEHQSSSVKELLPPNATEVVEKCLRTHSTFDFELPHKGRELRYSVSPFSNEDSVFWAITDITQLKKLECALRELNQSLEKKVLERTQELEATQDVTILSLSSLAETRDPDTGTHLNRTRLYVKTLANNLRTNPRFAHEIDSDETIDLLYRSAPLHDIGKVGIADSILLKPGPLTKEEFDLMKSHPKLGGDSLKLAEKELGSNAFLRTAWEIAYYHHEKWDGSGYPFGLKGNNIPIPARLMALADVYDALINERVYKKAFSHENARDIIVKGRGSHFDPDVVEAFLAEEQTFITIAREFSE